MESPDTTPSPNTSVFLSDYRRLRYLILVSVWVLIGIFQVASESKNCELGSHPDEAAHFVTGLMVRDYLASGFHESPLKYADEYYRHYPKIGLGVWPPFFYLVQAAWTLVFPANVASVLHLISLLSLGLAACLAVRLLRDFGLWQALAGTVILVSLPLVQMYSNMVMAEILSALLMFGATMAFARFLENGATRQAVLFGILAGLAIMTKGTGLALALVPPLAIVFTGRYDLLKNRRLWIAALIVVVIAGPWTWHFRNQGRGGWEEPNPSLHYTESALLFFGRQLAAACGWLLTLLALTGALTLFTPAGRKSTAPASCVALILAVWGFQSITPVGLEARHLTPAMPAMIYLALAGLNRLTVRRFQGAAAWLLLALFFGLSFLNGPNPAGYGSLGSKIALSPFRVPRKDWHGFKTLAQAAVDNHSRHMLVASDSRGEGMFIADVAMLDPHRPSFTVDRASKLLASSTWSGGTYQAFYTTPAQVADAVAKAGIDAIITDTSLAVIPPHHALLQQAATAWHAAQSATVIRDGKSFPNAATLSLRPVQSVQKNP